VVVYEEEKEEEEVASWPGWREKIVSSNVLSLKLPT
jgi:hypothetical protein